jgi:hypothetical protein
MNADLGAETGQFLPLQVAPVARVRRVSCLSALPDDLGC